MSDSNHSAKQLFQLDEDITYLNCANMSPMLKAVKQAGLRALETRANPWKIAAADWFTNAETLRGLAASIFQTKENNIALIPSASYGLAAAAKNLQLQAGKEIIVLDHQFPSNYYVWENMAAQKKLSIITIRKNNSQSLTETILKKINTNTGIIAVPNCHWIDGTWINLQQISDAAKTVGAYLVLDLSQSAGVLPIDIDRIQPDFAVTVGYKWLMGPYSLGYLYVSEKWQQQGEPLEYSWMTRKGSDDFAKLTDFTTEYRNGARKFDMGEMAQFNLLPMAIAGLQQLLDWKISSIQTQIKKLTDQLIVYKSEMGLMESNQTGVGHITSIPLGNINVDELKTRLQHNKVVISFRGTSIRVSPHLYNNLADIEKLLSCMQE